MSLITEALKFAAKRHEGQFRKFGNVSYMEHPKEVAFLLLAIIENIDSEILVAALLHDVVEDTYHGKVEEGLRDIEIKFGSRVKKLVDELTIKEELRKKYSKKEYLVYTMNRMSNDAFLIKLADRYHNIEGLLDNGVPIDFIKWYWEETIHIIDHLDREFTAIHDMLLSNINEILELIKKEKLT